MNRMVVPIVAALALVVHTAAFAGHHHRHRCGGCYDYCAPATCCAPASCCAQVSCCDSGTTAAACQTADSPAATDQGAATATTEQPPSPPEDAAPWTEKDEQRFAEITKHVKPDTKQKMADSLKSMSRSERDKDLADYEKDLREEVEKAKQEQNDKAKDTTDKAKPGAYVAPPEIKGFVLMRPVKTGRSAVAAIGTALAR